MRYPEYTGNEPRETIYVHIQLEDDGQPYATLHRSGPVREAAEHLFVPEQNFPVAEALHRADALTRKHGALLAVRIGEGVEWRDEWDVPR